MQPSIMLVIIGAALTVSACMCVWVRESKGSVCARASDRGGSASKRAREQSERKKGRAKTLSTLRLYHWQIRCKAFERPLTLLPLPLPSCQLSDVSVVPGLLTGKRAKERKRERDGSRRGGREHGI